MPNFPVLMLFCYLFKRLDWGSLLFSSRGSTLTQNKVFFGLIIPTTCIPCTIIAAMVHIHLTDDQESKTSQVRNLGSITDKGFKGRRKSLAGLKD